ncbi:MAG: quinone-dependent dihydroorotate dehydrogenase [Cytophagales bacterium]|nr:MAG: quinone-dependent dihydroorotate dehydrogenase [Cytophagales bacterium]
MYKQIIRPSLFQLDAEQAHEWATTLMKKSLSIPFIKSWIKERYQYKPNHLEKKLFGLTFKNPIGLAAGFDKNAEWIDELACFGFGFIEIGTLTPKPQDGNPKPRLFRLKKDSALINRMGFNNKGVQYAIEQLKKRTSTLPVGGNIGKNKDTPNELAYQDYLYCFEQLFDYVDYFVINVSSPNTPNLRALQEKEPLQKILFALQNKNQQQSHTKPILLKIAPDLYEETLQDIIEVVLEAELSGIIATNTTLNRENLQTPTQQLESIGAGGLSGKPLQLKSTQVIQQIYKSTNGKLPIIGVGGINNAKDVKEKTEAGAALVQAYTGFIYEGPAFVKKICQELSKNIKKT